jgi:hypothetical protein
MRSADELWERNLPRYFALYLTPQDGNNEIRFSLTRIAGRFAEEVYLAAAQVAREQGSSNIERIHVGWALHQRLPSEMNSYREVVFFPGAEESLRLAVEIYDLEVFRNTGFGWELLEKLATSEVVSRDTSLIIRPDAAWTLAEGINTYSLLVLRLAGRQAAETLSPRLFSRHLQLGVRSLAELLKANNDSAAVRGDRPIGGESEAVPSTFLRDVSKSAGVDFRHTSSEWLSLFRRYEGTFPTFGGGGVSAGDLDGDGWPDLVFCGGNGCTAYRNRGDGSFHEVGEDWGLRVPGEARMAVLADFDNDGQRDIFMTYVRDPNRLFRNLGGGRFADLSGSSGLAREGDISGPAIAFDYNGDGLLDIYLGNFGNYLEFRSPWKFLDAQNAMPNRLYRNLGNFRFEEVAETAGVGNTGWTQAISHVDTDRDGDQDIYVANDFGRNDLLINNGDGTFRSAGEAPLSRHERCLQRPQPRPLSGYLCHQHLGHGPTPGRNERNQFPVSFRGEGRCSRLPSKPGSRAGEARYRLVMGSSFPRRRQRRRRRSLRCHRVYGLPHFVAVPSTPDYAGADGSIQQCPRAECPSSQR